jgi:hypothetical protein
VSQHTAMQKPPMEKSDEANPEQLDMAREQGDTYLKALKKMANHEADDGGMKPAGDYVVAYAVESAEGMYQTRNGELEWQEPQSENVHVEVSVRDAADNRFIPGLTVYATVIDADDNVIGRHEQPFLWHPWLYHYGRNWEVPGDGIYKLRVEIEAPKFGRHDKKNGRRFAENVTVEFDDVKIEAGQKK